MGYDAPIAPDGLSFVFILLYFAEFLDVIDQGFNHIDECFLPFSVTLAASLPAVP